MIIDSHVHLWNFSPVQHAWITDDMEVFKRDFLPASFESLLNEHLISGCMAGNAVSRQLQ